MGDVKNTDLQVSFDNRVRVKFVGSKVSTDAGLLAYRELDEVLSLTKMSAEVLTDSRLGQNKQHGLVPMLRQSIYSRLAGYEDVNDAQRLAVDPAMRHVVGGRAAQADKEASSTSGVGRFETETLSTNSNLTALMNLSGEWIDKVHRCEPPKQLILDLDSSVSETYGRQEGTAYNGHFECNCYHPLFLFNQFGDLERAMLRRGNHASAKFWRRVLLPVIERYRHLDIPNFLRRLALPQDVEHWSLTTLREKLVKIGAKVTRHAKYVTFQLAEVAITRKLFAAILDRIERLALPPPVVARCSE